MASPTYVIPNAMDLCIYSSRHSPYIGSFWRIPGARRLQSCWRMVEESVVGATNEQAWVQNSSAPLLSCLYCFHICARCPIILPTRLDLFDEVYRRLKLHDELISRFTTRAGSGMGHQVLYRMFWQNRRTWVGLSSGVSGVSDALINFKDGVIIGVKK